MTEVAVTLYGPRKLDPDEYAAQQARKKMTARGGTVYGRRKGDDPPTAQAQPADAEETKEPEQAKPELPDFRALNLDRLEETMLEKPELLDEAIKAELADGKPRKGAIELFLEVEDARAEGPREEVVRLLRQFLQG